MQSFSSSPTLSSAYQVVESDTTYLDLLADARYLKLEVDLDIDLVERCPSKSVTDTDIEKE